MALPDSNLVADASCCPEDRHHQIYLSSTPESSIILLAGHAEHVESSLPFEFETPPSSSLKDSQIQRGTILPVVVRAANVSPLCAGPNASLPAGGIDRLLTCESHMGSHMDSNLGSRSNVFRNQKQPMQHRTAVALLSNRSSLRALMAESAAEAADIMGVGSGDLRSPRSLSYLLQRTETEHAAHILSAGSSTSTAMPCPHR